MKDVAAYGEVESAVRGAELEHALVFELEARREVRVARSRQLQMLVDDVNSEHLSARKEPSQTRGALTCAATGVEDVCLLREQVATNQRDFLRPNRSRLRVQVSHHRLVGHLLGLRIEIGHSVLP